VRLSGRHPLLRVVETAMNWRSRLTGIATGDQAIFVTRDRFRAVGGYPEIPLMEDIALSKALRHQGPPLCLRGPRDHLQPALGAARNRAHRRADVVAAATLFLRCGPGGTGATV